MTVRRYALRLCLLAGALFIGGCASTAGTARFLPLAGAFVQVNSANGTEVPVSVYRSDGKAAEVFDWTISEYAEKALHVEEDKACLQKSWLERMSLASVLDSGAEGISCGKELLLPKRLEPGYQWGREEYKGCVYLKRIVELSVESVTVEDLKTCEEKTETLGRTVWKEHDGRVLMKAYLNNKEAFVIERRRIR